MTFDVSKLKTVVVKIGTNLLGGGLPFKGLIMEAVVKELCLLKRNHQLNILIVSSGAVGCGMNALNITERPRGLPFTQAVAAVGQSTLVHYYETLFATYGEGLHAAQILLTLRDLDDRKSYLNVRNTIHALFDIGNVIPVLNENDSIAVEQLRFGDNDTLAAKVSAKISADLLIILSDVDGLYDKNPSDGGGSNLIEYVEEITPEIEGYAGDAGTEAATGGMRTKLEAARIASAAGVPVVIANGHRENIIQEVLQGVVPCTTFPASEDALSHRKRWIAFGRTTAGTLTVDEGASKALTGKGTSLLAAGIVAADGSFDVGDTVEILDQEGLAIARALVNYGIDDVLKIMGQHSDAIAAILGQKDFDEVVHRDNLVLV